MRRAALFTVLVAGALWPAASAACSETAPCLDAEPMWLAPGSKNFSFIGDAGALDFGKLAAAVTVGFRLKPAVLEAPSPNAAGREINLILHTTDLTAGVRLGVGNRMELTLSLPAGLYQRGAGIKAVTHQSAPPISEQSLHDPRLGFGYALPFRPAGIASKLRLELKLPLGDQEALMGEESFVLSPSLVLEPFSGGASRPEKRRWFLSGELGARMRRPVAFFGRRIGTQFFAAFGAGYALPRPRLSFVVEVYALRTLLAPVEAQDVAAEWLASIRYAPHAWQRLSFGLGGGTNIPAPRDDGAWEAGIGAPLLRVLAFARFTPVER